MQEIDDFDNMVYRIVVSVLYQPYYREDFSSTSLLLHVALIVSLSL